MHDGRCMLEARLAEAQAQTREAHAAYADLGAQLADARRSLRDAQAVAAALQEDSADAHLSRTELVRLLHHCVSFLSSS
jgi:hypothetical protein